MEEVVRRIIEIEKRAQDLIDSAKKVEEKKKTNLTENIKKLEEKTLNAAYQKVEQIRQREINEAKKEAEGLGKICEEKLKCIEEQYEKYHDTWCEQLVNAVLKR